MKESYDQHNRDLIKGILLYGIGTFGTKILSLLIVPLYTYYIKREDMGVYDILITTMGLLTPLLTLQISDAAYRWMIRNERIEDSIKATYRVLFFGSTLFLIIIFIVSLFVKIPYVWYFSFTLVLARFLESTQKLLRGLKNQKLYALSSILYACIFLVLNVLLIVYLKIGVEALFVSQMVACIVTIVVIFIAEKNIRFHPIYRNDYSFYKELLSFSIPLIPNILNWWIMSASDRYVIGIFLGTAFNGVYAISYKFPTILQQIFGLFNSSWQDLTISQKEGNSEYYSIIFDKLVRLTLTVIPLTIIVSQSYIIFSMNSNYHDSAKYVGFLFLGTVFQSFSSFFGVGYLITKNTKQASLTSIYGAITNFVVNIVLINFIGLLAAAFSTFVGFFVMFFIRYAQTKEIIHVRINWARLLLLLFVDIIFAVMFIDLNSTMIIPLFLVATVYFILFNFALIKSLFSKFISRLKSP